MSKARFTVAVVFALCVACAFGQPPTKPAEKSPSDGGQKNKLGVGTKTLSEGALVVYVVKDSAASKAGLEAGDVILSVDGFPVGIIDGLEYPLQSEIRRVKGTGTFMVQNKRNLNGPALSMEIKLNDAVKQPIVPISNGQPDSPKEKDTKTSLPLFFAANNQSVLPYELNKENSASEKYRVLSQDITLQVAPLTAPTASVGQATDNLSGTTTKQMKGKQGNRVKILDRAAGVKGDQFDIAYLVANKKFDKLEIDRTGKITWYKVTVLDGDLKGKDGWVPTTAVTRLYEIRLRTFIPCQIVSHPAALPLGGIAFPLNGFAPPNFAMFDPALHGDNRTFSYDKGTHRAGQNVVVTFHQQQLLKANEAIQREWGLSEAYFAYQTVHVHGKPWWWYRLKSDAELPVKTGTLGKSDANNKVTIAADETGETVSVRLYLNGKVPVLDTPAPSINADLVVQLKRIDKSDESVDFRILGSHDAFPSYEIYINAKRVYEYDAEIPALGPLNLLPVVGEVRVDKPGKVSP